MTWRQPGLGMDIKTSLLLDKNLPEFTLELSAEGKLNRPLKFPHPFVSESGTYLVVPMNEGFHTRSKIRQSARDGLSHTAGMVYACHSGE